MSPEEEMRAELKELLQKAEDLRKTAERRVRELDDAEGDFCS
jgi:hypothetical protein